MSVSITVQRSPSWRAATVLSMGALMLLYGGSFYTRDWRPAAPQAERSTERQATARSDATPRLDRVTHAEPRPLIEPETTGALAGVAEPPSGSTTAPHPSTSPSLQAQAAPPRPPAHQKHKRLAAGPTLTPARVAPSRAPSAAPVQFQLAERGN